MKKTTVLAYRNNETFQALRNAITQKATLATQKQGSHLITKVFDPATGLEVIDSWISSVRGEYEIVHFILDKTVSNRFVALGFGNKFGNLENCELLNDYIRIETRDTFKHMPVDQLYATCYSRLTASVQPDFWVIITDNITDYDPLGKFLKNPDLAFRSDEQAAYVELFRGFIPKDQNVVTCKNYEFDLNALKDKKIIVIAHHHAHGGVPENYLRGTKDGSMWLNTYPSGFLKKLIEVIRIDDLIGDFIKVIEERIISN